ncbi:MAG: leucine-rich repeat domain-containing protein [Anditalea sp.]
MIKNKLIIFSLIFVFSISYGRAQDLGEYTKEEIKEFSQKVEDQIRFLEFFLNTVGSKETSARDKDVIIRDSYKKIFRDGEVQVEDDLLLDRQVITNKDVTAYLKDVEFFFKDAEFKFKIREVKPSLTDNNDLFFVVSLDRTLTAIGLNEKEIENTKPRFVEINLDRDSNELKIASIYTTKLSRDKELAEWWESLSYEWGNYFREKYNFTEDSLTMDQINKISDMDSLDISGNGLIRDLSPLHALRELKYVNISNTHIQDLSPISNVTFLSYLDISNTPTEDIQFIKYSERLSYLDISNTNVSDIDELKNLGNLKHLKVVNTPLLGFGTLNAFSALETIDLEESGFNNLESISALKNLRALSVKGNYLINFEFIKELEQLESINLEETNIMDLSPLSGLENLKTININGTEVNNLDALNGLESLQRIYADRTSITEQVADMFARKNRSVLLIHNVETIQAWWKNLPEGWEAVFKKSSPEMDDNPSIEELYTLLGADSLDLSGSEIINLRPILKFKKINHLAFNDTKIHDISPLSELRTLKSISGNNSGITNLEALVHLKSLESLTFKATNIASIAPLKRLENLLYLDIDETEVSKSEIQGLLFALPEAIVVFRTEELKAWWDELDETWSNILTEQFNLDSDPSSKELHKITASPKVVIENSGIESLEPLLAFINLKDLDVHNAPLSDLSPVSQLELLQNLRISQAPIKELEPLSSLKELKTLNIANTGIDDLRPLADLSGLRSLDASGTNIKRLKGLEELYELRELDIASTNVRSLRPIRDLVNLEKLLCFNTRVNNRQINNFRQSNPECEIRYY